MTSLTLLELEQAYETRVAAGRGRTERYLVDVPNGEIVEVTVGATAEAGVIVEPAGLPEDSQTWGRRFAGPAWPSWRGVRGAIESVADDAAQVRARIL